MFILLKKHADRTPAVKMSCLYINVDHVVKVCFFLCMRRVYLGTKNKILLHAIMARFGRDQAVRPAFDNHAKAFSEQSAEAWFIYLVQGICYTCNIVQICNEWCLIILYLNLEHTGL